MPTAEVSRLLVSRLFGVNAANLITFGCIAIVSKNGLAGLASYLLRTGLPHVDPL